MLLMSTRDKSITATFCEAIFQGLSPDGGLYQPTAFSDLSDVINGFEDNTDFVSIASELSAELLSDELAAADVADLCSEAF